MDTSMQCRELRMRIDRPCAPMQALAACMHAAPTKEALELCRRSAGRVVMDERLFHVAVMAEVSGGEVLREGTAGAREQKWL